jgi:putative FmdB family regulatory protein
MPTYEFRCPEGHEFEIFYRSIGAAPRETVCPTCGKIAERLLSAGGGLLFKGSGFYITDYGKDGKKAQTAPAGEGGSKGDSGAKADPTAKPDAKPTDAKPVKEPKTDATKSGDKPAPAAKPKGSE